MSTLSGKRKIVGTKRRVSGYRQFHALKRKPQNKCELVGDTNTARVFVNGVSTLGLIDTGSQITSISYDFLQKKLPDVKVMELDELLTVRGAGGYILPYVGYVDLEITIDGNHYFVPVLVIQENFSDDVPLILGTNLLKLMYNNGKDIGHTSLQLPLKEVMQNMAKTDIDIIGIVRSSKQTVLQPGQTTTVTGISRACAGIRCAKMTVMTDDFIDQALPGGLRLIPSVLNVTPKGKSFMKVSVDILNTSTKSVTIPSKHSLCKLQRVEVVTEPLSGKMRQTGDSKSSSDADLLEKDVGPDSAYLDHFVYPDDAEQAKSLRELLCKWKDVFAIGDDQGHTDAVKHHIKLTDETPIKMRHRRIPPAMYIEVRDHLSKMLQSGTIRPSNSPWSFPAVIVRKKDLSIRFCVDYRELNRRTIKDAYALPRIDETLDALAGAKYFSCLDLKNGYWQIELAEQDKQKTAFTAGPLGFFEFNSMPFGLTNSPATFQRLMHTCMGDLNLVICLLFLDDIVVFSSTWEEHIQRLEAVFQRLKDYGLKLKPSKCEFFKPEVRYLGHIVSEQGVQTDPEKVAAVLNWPTPTSVKDVQRFLGFIGFYRRFIKGFSSLARPLNELLKGHGGLKKKTKVEFKWGELQSAAFIKLKDCLVSAPILGYAHFSLPFELHVDASTDGLGAILYQQQEGIPRVIAYASRRLSDTEKKYPAHKLEFLALKWAISEKFHDYLYGQKFMVLTDNNPLTYVLTTAKLDAAGYRWLAQICSYDFSIRYRSGKTNIDADALSRLPEIDSGSVKAICQQGSQEDVILSLPVNVSAVDDLAKDCLSTLKPIDMRQLQRADKSIHHVIQCIESGLKPERSKIDSLDRDLVKYLSQWDKLEIQNGILMRKFSEQGHSYHQTVVPRSCRQQILSLLHDDMAHPGRERTFLLVKQRFYWPRMYSDIEYKVQHCRRCVCRKTVPGKAYLTPIYTSHPLELVCMDFLQVEPSAGYEHLLVITDHFTKLARVVPLRNESAKSTAKALYEQFINIYGFPERLHSDQGRNFESRVIQELCSIAGVKKSRTTPYHAMGNGACERFNRTLLNMLGTLNEDQKSRWKEHLGTLVHCYNCTPHQTTGYTPYKLMFGRDPNLPVDNLYKAPTEGQCSPSEFYNKLRKEIVYCQDLARKHSNFKANKVKQYYDVSARASGLEIGDVVLVRKVGIKGRQKLKDKWIDTPYVVIEKPNVTIPVYKVRPISAKGPTRTLHRNMLLPLGEKMTTTNIGPPSKAKTKGYSKPKTESEEEVDSDSSEEILLPYRLGIEDESDAHLNDVTINHDVPAISMNDEFAQEVVEEQVIDSTSDSDVPLQTQTETEEELLTPEADPSTPIIPRRSTRVRRPPNWLQSGNWEVNLRPQTAVRPSRIRQIIDRFEKKKWK